MTAQQQISSLIKNAATVPQLFVQEDLRLTEEENAEAKAFQRLGEGTGSEEEGEFLVFTLLFLLGLEVVEKGQLICTN